MSWLDVIAVTRLRALAIVDPPIVDSSTGRVFTELETLTGSMPNFSRPHGLAAWSESLRKARWDVLRTGHLTTTISPIRAQVSSTFVAKTSLMRIHIVSGRISMGPA